MFRQGIPAILALGIVLSSSLLNAQGFGNGPPGGGFPGPGGPFPGGLPGGAAQNQDVDTGSVNASFDTRTNTVIIVGSSTQLASVAKVIADLDANPAANNQIYVYKIRNGSAINIEAVANLLFNGTGGNNRGASSSQQLNSTRTGATGLGGGPAAGGGGRGGGLGTTAGLGGGFGTGGGGVIAGAAGGAGVSTASLNAAASIEEAVTVVADPITNSLLVTTNPKNWPRVKSILDELDRSIPQVLIKVLIAEVSHNNGTDLGADLSILNLRLDPSGSLTEGQSGKTVFGAPATGGLIVINESNFGATIHALQTSGKVDVLSRPYILATDNQLATITVGQTVPYVSNSQITTEGNTINTVAYSNVGVLMDVIPHINPDGMVILDIAPEISSLADSTVAVTTGVTAPVFNTRSAQSRVAVHDGQTVVIGGLMQDQFNSTVNKIPLLGDIPFIGAAFQRKVESKTKTELLIFLTPHVAMRPEQLQAMGADELKTTKLVPNAVAPGTFQEQQRGLDAGVAPTSQP